MTDSRRRAPAWVGRLLAIIVIGLALIWVFVGFPV